MCQQQNVTAYLHYKIFLLGFSLLSVKLIIYNYSIFGKTNQNTGLFVEARFFLINALGQFPQQGVIALSITMNIFWCSFIEKTFG